MKYFAEAEKSRKSAKSAKNQNVTVNDCEQAFCKYSTHTHTQILGFFFRLPLTKRKKNIQQIC